MIDKVIEDKELWIESADDVDKKDAFFSKVSTMEIARLVGDKAKGLIQNGGIEKTVCQIFQKANVRVRIEK